MFRELRCFPNGVAPEYTFFTDFDIACHFGVSAIKDTYRRVLESWGDNYKAMTEVSLCLNLLCWDYYENGKMAISGCLSDLYYDSRDFFYEKYENDKVALHHYFVMTD